VSLRVTPARPFRVASHVPCYDLGPSFMGLSAPPLAFMTASSSTRSLPTHFGLSGFDHRAAMVGAGVRAAGVVARE
jgi:hypothetical protein